MGTRSTVKFYEEYDGSRQCVCAVYQQYDGYPEGVGYGLADFLAQRTVVNGFGMDMEMPYYANGIGCLAAQYVKETKKGVGGLYMTTEGDSQEYDYIVSYPLDKAGKQAGLRIVVKYWGEVIFKGTLVEFRNYCMDRAEELE